MSSATVYNADSGELRTDCLMFSITFTDVQSIRFILETSLPSYEDVEVAFIVTLPASYPHESPPRLQLSSKVS